jgi:hypothetical protein
VTADCENAEAVVLLEDDEITTYMCSNCGEVYEVMK